MPEVLVERVRSILGVPGTEPRSARTGERLETVDQVFVGKELDGEWEADGGAGGAGSLEDLLHGLNEEGRGEYGSAEWQQLGSGSKRVPSPMLWRVFPVHGRKAVLPVMTWFPRGYGGDSMPQISSGSGLYRYLQSVLGFEASLTGERLSDDALEGADVG